MSTKLVNEELSDLEYELSNCDKYSVQDITDICTKLLEKAKEKGLSDCYLMFYSNNEPYEDYLGNPSIVPCGYRPRNDTEINKDKMHREIEKIGKKFDISHHDAAVLNKILNKGYELQPKTGEKKEKSTYKFVEISNSPRR